MGDDYTYDYTDGKYVFLRSNFCSDQIKKITEYIDTNHQNMMNNSKSNFVLFLGGSSWDIMKKCHVVSIRQSIIVHTVYTLYVSQKTNKMYSPTH